MMTSMAFLRTVMYKRQIVSIGKRYLTANIAVVGKKNSVEDWIASGYDEYEKRLRPFVDVNTIFLKNDDDLEKFAKTAKGFTFALDEYGKTMTSREFSVAVTKAFEDGGSCINFLIGGYDGLPESIRQKYPLLSLSKLTWTHQMARLLLIEQIYRAIEIKRGTSYHKE